MNDDTEQPNSDAQKAKTAAGPADAKRDDHKKKEGKHDKPAEKKVGKEHGHHS
ncbi:MAG: hypothetical protein ACTFAL_05690 [Candidatus Electronema sp. V4]|uniref:hypothetical protein n=1 Tax=Candidatus Electronema sp. V4 TaxID=3454756 RepID=UPI004055536B